MGNKKRVNLMLADGEDESFLSFRRQQLTEGGIFILCSVLFRHLGGLVNDVLHGGRLAAPAEIEAALRGFYGEVNGREEITDQPISVKTLNFNPLQMIGGIDPGPDQGGMLSFFSEVLALYGLTVAWLDPREVAGGQLFAKQWVGDPDNYYFFKHRCRQFHFAPTVVSGRFTLVYDSEGLLPLCWAELMHALLYKLKAGVCPYCHKVYLYPGNNYQKAHCGEAACKKAHLVYRHGGSAGYSAWEKERKKNSGGKRGRPRKTESVTGQP